MNIETLKLKKKQLGLTFEELAKRSNVSVRTLKAIFNGERENTTLTTMIAIESALGLSETDPLQWSDEEKALGVVPTIRRNLTPKEDECNTLFKAIGAKKGANAQALALKVLEQILNN